MTKDLTTLYACFDGKPQWTQVEIREIIKNWVAKNMNFKSNMNKPATVEVGDVILYHIATMFHPCVIFRKDDKACYALVISSKNHPHHFLSKIENSRIFINSNFSITVVSFTKETALDNFVGIFDSPKELKTAIKLLKEKYKEIL